MVDAAFVRDSSTWKKTSRPAGAAVSGAASEGALTPERPNHVARADASSAQYARKARSTGTRKPSACEFDIGDGETPRGRAAAGWGLVAAPAAASAASDSESAAEDASEARGAAAVWGLAAAV